MSDSLRCTVAVICSPGASSKMRRMRSPAEKSSGPTFPMVLIERSPSISLGRLYSRFRVAGGRALRRSGVGLPRALVAAWRKAIQSLRPSDYATAFGRAEEQSGRYSQSAVHLIVMDVTERFEILCRVFAAPHVLRFVVKFQESPRIVRR